MGVLLSIASPFGLIVAGIAAAVGAFLYFSGTGSMLLQRLQEGFSALYDGFMKSFGAIANAIMAGDWQAAWDVAWTGVKALWSAGLQWCLDTFAEFTEMLFGSEIADWFREISGVIMKTLGTAFNWIMEVWPAVSATFMNGLSQIYEFFAVWATRIVYYIRWVYGIYEPIIQGFVKYIQWLYGIYKPIIEMLYNMVYNYVSSLINIYGKFLNILQTVAGWVLKFIDRLTGADKKIAEIRKNAEFARENRSANAAGTIAARQALPNTPSSSPIPYSLSPDPSLEIPQMDGLDDLIDSNGLKVHFDDTAIQDWENAIAKANAAVIGDGLDLPGLNTETTRRLRGLAIGDSIGESKQKIDSVGTFSAFAAASLDNSAQNKTAENTAEIARLLKQIRRDGGSASAFAW
ncbi:MAG: hypothetical protein FWD31_14765 [Planctomycetaceae bacterium]|nr:hypothetical protein [Planctomycetaceae bacterium]